MKAFIYLKSAIERDKPILVENVQKVLVNGSEVDVNKFRAAKDNDLTFVNDEGVTNIHNSEVHYIYFQFN